jgi:hypothetical protein
MANAAQFTWPCALLNAKSSFSIILDFGAADRDSFFYTQLYEDGASRDPP